MSLWDLVQSSPLDKYWQDPNLTLTTLLLDENIITQLKNQNPQLLQYLQTHKQQFIDQLLQYVTVMPTISDSHNRAHKLPYISSELLALHSPLIHQEFFKEEITERDNPNWKKLVEFLDSEGAENEVLMGYFEKVISNLYNGNKSKTTKIVSEHIGRFMRHICSGSVGDILTNSIVLLYTPEEAVLPARQHILGRIVEAIVTEPQQTKAVCSAILTTVVEKFQAFSSGDHLISCLLNSPRLSQIYQLTGSSAINRFLVSLVRKSQQTTVNEKDETVRLLSIPSHHQGLITKYLKRECEFLEEWTGSSDYIQNQSGVTVRKSNRKVYELLGLAGLQIEQGRYQFVGSKLLSNIWNLVVMYPYNNILQVASLKIFRHLLKKGDQPIRKIFMNRYEQYLLQLANHNLEMLRPFIFRVWIQAKDHPTVTDDSTILAKFDELVSKELQPLLKYEVKPQVQQVRQGQKLIVDENDVKKATQDGTTEAMSVPVATVPQVNEEESVEKAEESSEKGSNWPSDKAEPSQKASVSETSWFDEEDTKPAPAAKESSFDFFDSWSEKGSEKKREVKKDAFADFSGFF